MKLDGANIIWLLLVASGGLAAAKWAFLPERRLRRHRVKRTRIRLLLRLHPGKGHATVVEV